MTLIFFSRALEDDREFGLGLFDGGRGGGGAAPWHGGRGADAVAVSNSLM